MPDLTTSETLNLAADYLQQYGHLVGDKGSPGGPRCMIGAICSAAGDEQAAQPYGNDHSAYYKLREYLGDYVADWNDRHSAPEAIAALRACAVIESAREVRTTLAGLPGSEVPA